jgi:hypothetical protein
VQDRAKAIELYKRASDLGVEESEMKIQVLEDRVARESEIEQLENRLGNIKDGFIQLQLERSATEEVTHAYKGAGFFLSNVKSETPIRARIEQAQKAEQEIKHLRTEVVEREKERKALMQGHEGKMHEIEHLHDMVRFFFPFLPAISCRVLSPFMTVLPFLLPPSTHPGINIAVASNQHRCCLKSTLLLPQINIAVASNQHRCCLKSPKLDSAT